MKNYFHISLMIVLVMTVSLPASAQYYRNGQPIPPSKRASYYSQHQYGASRDGDTYFGLRLGFGVSTVSSDNTLNSATLLKSQSVVAQNRPECDFSCSNRLFAIS